MKNKTQLWIAGVTTSLGSFIGWLATVPPEQQDALMAPIVSILPLHWRPAIGLISRALASGGAIWGLYVAHRGPTGTPGPAQPPSNPSGTTIGKA